MMNTIRPDKNEITQTLLRGKNCGQCLLERYAEGFGFDREDTDRIAACFGGGLEMGQTCGAVAGAVIVLGLAGVEPKDAREAVAKLRRRFEARHGSCICAQLLGADMSDPQQAEAAKASGILMERCTSFIGDAMDILDQLLPELGGD